MQIDSSSPVLLEIDPFFDREANEGHLVPERTE